MGRDEWMLRRPEEAILIIKTQGTKLYPVLYSTYKMEINTSETAAFIQRHRRFIVYIRR